MKTPKHTPGPWKIETYHDCTFRIIRDLEPGEEPAHRLTHDARLIAAAPEMFEILEFLIDHNIQRESREYSDGTPYEIEVIHAYDHTVKEIRELIKKIKG